TWPRPMTIPSAGVVAISSSRMLRRGGAGGGGGAAGRGAPPRPRPPPPPGGGAAGPPLVLWEGELVDGTHDLLLHPVIWDVDTPRSYLQRSLGGYCASALCTWHKYLTGPSNSTYRRPEVAAAITGSQIAVKEGNDIWMGSNGYMVHMENIDKDRPIGMEVGANAPRGMGLVARMRDRVVVLSREKIETALRSGNARIEVRFWDHWVLPGQPATTVNYLGGDYTLVLRVDRVQ
ncbi:MAG: hypothetical protein LH467_09990, partial [Gemmatimonadaceae bacterium]|nr:hypothetical protein [Gemmatimonadaceae bacterium]